MKFATAQRRLVKSPPELWAEVSSEDSLGRRLAEFGEIRITRVEPETTVAWEGDRASGTVELAPAGWGTKVILTATPLLEAGAEAAVEEAVFEAPPVAEAIAAPAREPQPEAIAATACEPQPAAIAATEPEPEPLAEPERVALAEPEPTAPPPDPAPPRRGLFARLFRRAPAPRPALPPPAPQLEIPAPPAPGPDPSPPAPGPDPTPPDPGPAPGPVPVPDPVGPLPEPDPTPPQIGPQPDLPPAAAVTEPPLDAERTVAILSDVLDDLGAAHHRPFSRD